MKLNERIARDTANATGVSQAARRQLDPHKVPSFRPTVDIAHGVATPQLEVLRGLDRDAHALHVIAGDPFHAMLEAEIEGPLGGIKALWYAKASSINNIYTLVCGLMT